MEVLQLAIYTSVILTCYGSNAYRLPKIVHPTLYELYLNINPDVDTYSGIANITLRTSNYTKDVYLHSSSDFIDIGLVILNNNAKCYVDSTNETDLLKISCSRSLVVDEDNQLYLEFTSKFSLVDGYGLYKTTYISAGNQQVIVESNFMPIYARRAFPCLDEPAFKARFALEVTYPQRYSVLTNSPVVRITGLSDNWQRTKFDTTPKISTYLFSIFISNLQTGRITSEEEVKFKIFARPDIVLSTIDTANTYHSQIIAKMNEYTGIPYQNLSEIESYLIAVPDYTDPIGDFGLFSYREVDLLDEGVLTSNRAKQNILTTMTYKLAHEWYGGDVATKWWSDIWANEAVATYFKYFISNEVDEEMELTKQFLLEVTQKALQYDAYNFEQPLSSKESDIDSEWKIEEQLNSVNYGKGASILHMITCVIRGEENFKLALQTHWRNRSVNSTGNYTYFRKESGTSGTDILKDLLDGNSDGEEYYSYLEQWILTPGYPLITATLKEANVTDVISLTQKRFIYPPLQTNNMEWYIPLTSASQTNNPSDILFDSFLAPDTDAMYMFGHDLWLLFNNQGGCFYRVNYDEILWRRILDGLNTDRSSFHVLQRAQLVDDIFNVARIGDVNYSLVFELADTLLNETEYYPWYSAFNAFSYILGKIQHKETEMALKKYILKLMENIIVIPNEYSTMDTDNHMNVLKNVMVLDWACYLGYSDCIMYTTEMFNNYKGSQASLKDYNMRSIIFCNGIRYSTNIENDWAFLWNIYNKTLSAHEQNDILKSLGCAENMDLLKSYLKKIINVDSGIKKQDAVIVFTSVFSSSLGLEAAMNFLEYYCSNIQKFFKDMKFLSEMIYAVAEKLITDEHVIWLQKLLDNSMFDNYADVKSRALSLALVNNYWYENYQSDVAHLFPYISSSTESTTPGETTMEPSTTPYSKSTLISASSTFLLVLVSVLCNIIT